MKTKKRKSASFIRGKSKKFSEILVGINSEKIIENYCRYKEHITDEQFDYCVRKNPKMALRSYSDIKNKLTDEQLRYCVDKEPKQAIITIFNSRDTSIFDRLTEKQIARMIAASEFNGWRLRNTVTQRDMNRYFE